MQRGFSVVPGVLLVALSQNSYHDWFVKPQVTAVDQPACPIKGCVNLCLPLEDQLKCHNLGLSPPARARACWPYISFFSISRALSKNIRLALRPLVEYNSQRVGEVRGPCLGHSNLSSGISGRCKVIDGDGQVCTYKVHFKLCVQIAEAGDPRNFGGQPCLDDVQHSYRKIVSHSKRFLPFLLGLKQCQNRPLYSYAG